MSAASDHPAPPTRAGPDEPLPVAAKDPNLGRVIDGRYVMERRIGEGGMGAVYEARHAKLGRRVAVKLIHEELANRREVIARFEREVEANARLEHPHIATAIDCGVDGGATYLVMQLVRGTSLRALMDEGPVPWPRACEIGAQIADALAAAHDAGVIHRDLKPSNVLLEEAEQGGDFVRVLDFGIASLLDDSSGAAPRALTREGHVVGTLGYMAPEQALARDATAKADVYALGVLLWEMVAGRKLFERTELTISSYIVRQLTEPAPRLTDVPTGLSDLVARMLVTDVEERATSAAGVRDALRGLAAAPPDARDAPPAEQTLDPSVPAPIGPAATARRPAPPPLAWRLAGPVVAALAGAVMFLGALGSAEVPPRWSKGKTRKAKAVAVAEDLPVAPAPPDPLEIALDALVRPADDWRVRREAARQLMDHEDVITPFARDAARLEIAASCEVRVEAAQALADSGDPRAEGVLRRRRRDRCRALRRAIDDALRALR